MDCGPDTHTEVDGFPVAPQGGTPGDPRDIAGKE